MANSRVNELVSSSDQSPLREMAARRLQREFRKYLARRRLKRIAKAKRATKKVSKLNASLMFMSHR